MWTRCARHLLDAGPDVAPGTPFIAMEFIEGETLAERLGREGRLRPIDAIDVALQIADGLWEAHSHQIIHRDLKPHNVMFTAGGRVKIVDFGLAKPLRAAIAGEGLVRTSEMLSTDLGGVTVIGTCAHTSLEQAAGRPLDSHSDIFSFGTLLYEMVTVVFRSTARPPPRSWPRFEADPEPLANVTGGGTVLKRLIGRCLEKRPTTATTTCGRSPPSTRAARNRLTRGMRWRVKELLDHRPLGDSLDSAPRRCVAGAILGMACARSRLLPGVCAHQIGEYPSATAESLDNADVTEPQPQRLDGAEYAGRTQRAVAERRRQRARLGSAGPSSTTVTGPSKEHPVQPERPAGSSSAVHPDRASASTAISAGVTL